MAEELKPFKREDRYIVIKRKDLAALADKGELRPASLDGLMDLCADLPAREYVVIESDWPEYPIVWQMIKARMNGSAQLPSQGGEAVAWRVTGRDGLTITAQYPKWAEADCLLTITPLYTHPADQVEDGVVVSRELLVKLLDEGKRADTWAAQDKIRALLARGVQS